MLGDDYPGFFPVRDTVALRDLLLRFESDRQFASQLRSWCASCRSQFSEQRERRSLRRLFDELRA